MSLMRLARCWRRFRRADVIPTNHSRPGCQCAAACTFEQPRKQQGILYEYNRLVDTGQLQKDTSQLAAVQALQLLQDDFAAQLSRIARQQSQHDLRLQEQARHSTSRDSNCTPASVSSHSTDTSSSNDDACSTSSSSSRSTVQGAYLWGPVGSGKTMLMDLFLNTLPTLHLPPQPQGSGSPSASSSTTPAATPSSTTNATAAAVGQSAQAHGANADIITEQQLYQQGPSELAVPSARLHFHSFMLGVHQQLHRLHQSLPKVVGRSRAGLPVYRHALPPEDPVITVARSAAANIQLLCLDELHVTDVADAMLLSRLFHELLQCGCSVVFTSNRPVRDLYKGGLSRRYFEPFVHLVDDRLIQLRVAGGQDYRADNSEQQQQHSAHKAPNKAAGRGVWLVGPDSNTQLQQQWKFMAQELTDGHMPATDAAAAADASSDLVRSTSLQLPFGRKLWIPRALQAPGSSPSHTQGTLQQQQQQDQGHAGIPSPQQQQDNTGQNQPQQQPTHQAYNQQQQQQMSKCLAGAYFTFDQLCGNTGSRQTLAAAGALSATDYQALVLGCHRLYVEGIPQLTTQHRDEARRLVTLVDLLYEEHTLNPGAVQLCVSAQVDPHHLFMPLLGAAAVQGINPNLGRSGHKLDVKALLQVAKANAQHSDVTSGSAVAGEDAAVSARPTRASSQSDAATAHQLQEPAQQQQQRLHVPQPPALLAEEVLMYHRASSRLLELCACVGVAQ